MEGDRAGENTRGYAPAQQRVISLYRRGNSRTRTLSASLSPFAQRSQHSLSGTASRGHTGICKPVLQQPVRWRKSTRTVCSCIGANMAKPSANRHPNTQRERGKKRGKQDKQRAASRLLAITRRTNRRTGLEVPVTDYADCQELEHKQRSRRGSHCA